MSMPTSTSVPVHTAVKRVSCANSSVSKSVVGKFMPAPHTVHSVSSAQREGARYGGSALCVALVHAEEAGDELAHAQSGGGGSREDIDL